MITLYVLRSQSCGKRYVGITNNLARRLKEHGGLASKAGQLLGRADLIYTEQFPDYEQARKREKFLKSGKGRQWLDEAFGRSRPA